MENQVLEINRSYVKRKINSEIDSLFDEIKTNNKAIEELQSRIKLIQKARVDLARAYARKLNILITKNKWIKFQNKIIKKDFSKGILEVEGSEEFASNQLNKVFAIQDDGEKNG